MKMTPVLLLCLIACCMKAQQPVLILDNSLYVETPSKIHMGQEIKLDTSGKEFKGTLDGILGDALIMGTDTIPFNKITLFKWRNIPSKKKERLGKIGMIGTLGGIVLLGVDLLALQGHDRGSNAIAGIAGVTGLIGLYVFPWIWIGGRRYNHAWHSEFLSDGWYLSSKVE